MDRPDELYANQPDGAEPRLTRALRRLARIGLGALGGAALGGAYLLLGACPGGSCHITSNPGLLLGLGALVGGFAATR